MFSFLWTFHWWYEITSNLPAFAATLLSFMCEWIGILAVVLFVYYWVTVKKRSAFQTIAGIPCAVFLIGFNFLRYPKIYEVTYDVVGHNNFQPIAWFSFFLALPILLAAMMATLLGIVNLCRKRLFSRKQVLMLALPVWFSWGLHTILNWCLGGYSPNRFLGIPELILALMLTLTLTKLKK